jgi:hypothetical protein
VEPNLLMKHSDPMHDFRNFLYVIWMHLKLPDPTPAQYEIAHFLQNSPKRITIEAFRGIGKSYITAAYVCWRLYLDAEVKIMVVSAGKDRADAFSIFVKALLRDVPMLQHLQPRPDLGHRDSNVAFDVNGSSPSGSPSVKSVGISGQMTGSRADVIIADDIEIPSNSATHDLREKLQERVKEFSAVLKPDGKIIYLGTPQTELSLYNVLESRGYQTFIYPARYPTQEQMAGYGSRIAPKIVDDMELGSMAGDPTDPLRFDNKDLLERELEYGRSGFALQFMLDTSLSDANKFPLKINDLIISSVGRDTAPNIIRWTNNPLSKLKDLPNLALAGQDYYSSEAITSVYSPYEASVLSIDPSGRGVDETGYAVGKMLAGNVFIPDAGGITGGYSDEALIAICNKAKEHKVNLILIESNFGDGMFSNLLKPHLARIYPCTVEEVRHNQQKELRIIETLEPVMNQHRLVVDPKVILRDYESAKELYSPDKAPQFMLFYQLSRISKQRGSLKHDDRLDAFAMVVRYFTDKLGNDQENQEKRRKEELFDDYVDQFVKEMGGSANKGANWQSRMYSKLGRR